MKNHASNIVVSGLKQNICQKVQLSYKSVDEKQRVSAGI